MEAKETRRRSEPKLMTTLLQLAKHTVGMTEVSCIDNISPEELEELKSTFRRRYGSNYLSKCLLPKNFSFSL